MSTFIPSAFLLNATKSKISSWAEIELYHWGKEREGSILGRKRSFRWMQMEISSDSISD